MRLTNSLKILTHLQSVTQQSATDDNKQQEYLPTHTTIQRDDIFR